MSDTVHLKWKLEPGEFTAEEIKEEGVGGTDALVLVSIRRGPQAHQGSKSWAVISIDGWTKKACPDTELFQAMSVLAKRVADSTTVPQWQREMSKGVFEAIRSEIVLRRGGN